VWHRSIRPDEEALNDAMKELQKKNIDVNQLVEWPVDHCQQVE